LEPARQKQLLDHVGMLRRDSQHFGELPVVFGGAAIQCHGPLGKRQRSGMIAEGVSDLREQEVSQRVAGRFPNSRLDDGAGSLPMAGFDQLLGGSLLRPAQGRRPEDRYQRDCGFGFHSLQNHVTTVSGR